MANNNLAFVAQEWLEPIAKCPAECRNSVILAIVEYQLTGNVPELEEGIASVAFSYIKPNVDRMAQFRRQQADRRKPSSSKSTKREPELTETEPEITEADRTETENDQYSKSKSESKTKSKSKNNQESVARTAPFPPSISDIENFCRVKGIANVDARKFYDYYSLRAWMTAQGNPVRDWQAQVVTWSARETEAKAATAPHIAPVPVTVVASAEELAKQEAADKRERLKRRAEMEYYIANVPGANTSAAPISYPEFCALGLHNSTPVEIAGVLDKVRRGLIPRNPIFA